MSTDTDTAEESVDARPEPSADDLAALRGRVDELEGKLAESEADAADDERSMVIVATKGTLDMAYPPLILASTAAAFGWNVTVFHTFWGLDILHEERSKDLKLSAVGNPNMRVPNAVAAIPGMDRVASTMMRKRFDSNDVASIEDLVDTCDAMGVEMQACQMTIDLLEYDEDDFYDGVTVGVGAATAVERMADADIQLLV
jgi:peroxiredoxin family protein